MKPSEEAMHKANEDTFNRVRNQVNNLGSVDKTEAFVICLAYTRCLAQIMAQLSENDGDFISKLDELQGLMLNEGTMVRRTLGMPS